jgi:hypothetical protein
MAPSMAQLDTDLVNGLASVCLSNPNSYQKTDSHQLDNAQTNVITSPSKDQPAGIVKRRVTLETLPPEIKGHIFSNLLLGEKVRYPTAGIWPGHKYKFDTAIMLTSKRMYTEATAYLHANNEFALIHSKFFAFAIDKRRFLPMVASGRPAKSFSKPAIEATIAHLETRCSCCHSQQHAAKDRVTIALFLVADLEHVIRELRLVFHIWPTQPIYVLSAPDAAPVRFISVNVHTQVKLVWKVGPAYRQDLSRKERRSRQARLMAPLELPAGAGKTTSVVGVDKDIASRVTCQQLPRVLNVQAVGWDLYKLMQSQKKHLDNILSQRPCHPSYLLDAYLDLACVGWDMHIPGHSQIASVLRSVNTNGTLIALGNRAFDHLDDIEDYKAAVKQSWQLGVTVIVLDCLFTVMRIGLEDDNFTDHRNCYLAIQSILTYSFREKSHVLPERFTSLSGHYTAHAVLSTFLNDTHETGMDGFVTCQIVMATAKLGMDIDHVCDINQCMLIDLRHLQDVISVSFDMDGTLTHQDSAC